MIPFVLRARLLRCPPLLVVVVLVAAAGMALDAAKTDITANFDKTFSFAGLRTWAWHPDGAGEVKMAVSSGDNPQRVAGRVDPIILPAVERELKTRGFTKTEGAADLQVHYYVLATVQTSSQYMGQFIAPIPEWGIPPFAPITTAVEIFPFGTLLIDITSPAKKAIVWRGSAQRKIDLEKPDSERRAVLERAIHDLISRFPPKQK
jgi:Domain of unknown function (DUF4136)